METKEAKEAFKKKSLCGIVLVAVIVSVTFIYFWQSSLTNQTFELKAVIVDQVAITGLDPVFVEAVTNILEEAGYTVDYYGGREVTVNFYRNLPKQGYGIIMLRVHSGVVACLYSGERYEQSKYVNEQLTGQLLHVTVDFEESQSYFGITPNFVKNSMRGKFKNSTILMMGCSGLTNTYMAEAFIEKGAKVYIGWDGLVSASRTDQATTQLLQSLITEKQTIEQAVTEVGPDPDYRSTLAYYPPEAGNEVIAN